MLPRVLRAQREECTLELRYSDGLNYALAHNEITPISELVVANNTTRVLESLVIELSLDAPTRRPVAEPLRLHLPDIPPGPTTRLDVPTWSLDPLTFAELDEALTGTLSLRLAGVSHPVRVTAPIRLLARDEWWATDVLESLTAFVTPRDPAVADLLSEASELLLRSTGNSSLQGYQAGSRRALEIFKAVYQAMADRRIRYIDPPPSFEGTGQKIRPPREVLGRMGNVLGPGHNDGGLH